MTTRFCQAIAKTTGQPCRKAAQPDSEFCRIHSERNISFQSRQTVETIPSREVDCDPGWRGQSTQEKEARQRQSCRRGRREAERVLCTEEYPCWDEESSQCWTVEGDQSINPPVKSGDYGRAIKRQIALRKELREQLPGRRAIQFDQRMDRQDLMRQHQRQRPTE
jgi:hypothetical protein